MSNIDIAKKSITSYNTASWKDYADLFAEDCVYDEKATGAVDSRAEALRLFQAWKAGMPDSTGTIKAAFAAGDTVVLELEWRGTHSGTLVGKLGTLPPTGRSFRVPACQVIRFEGDKIVEVHHYFDVASLLTQLGVMPRLGVSEAHAPSP
jgi:steroid delta-isomerase-like uncharacterized protein